MICYIFNAYCCPFIEVNTKKSTTSEFVPSSALYSIISVMFLLLYFIWFSQYKKLLHCHLQFISAASGRGLIHNSYDTVDIKTEDCSSSAVPQSRNINLGESCKGKKPKEESFDDFPVSLPQVKQSIYEKNRKGKRPKQDYVDNTSSFLDPSWLEEKVDPNITRFEMPRAFKSNSCKSVDKMVAKPPYFFYGNVVNLSYDWWAKISQFLYGIEPEFVNTQFFSALSRKEGYVHNLPAGNRFRILPKYPLPYRDAIPQTKKW